MLAGIRWSGSEWPAVNVPSLAPASPPPPQADSPSEAASTTAAIPLARPDTPLARTPLTAPLWLRIVLPPVAASRRGCLATRRT
ncbi:hypothetical protein GCM10009546_61250 [Actinomadura livida]|uniref:Uncharacterized protein n=1 Tax=Actinomadura livida TaxID=79909 RepID=A0ABP3QH38_9ACTN|nr:hypothetical protein GCM10010208_69300 [Actinomadura livida]